MAPKLLRASMVTALVAIVFPAAGCIQYKDEIVLLPDGSGKMTLHMAFNLEIFEKLREMGMDPEEAEEDMEFNLEDFENLEGIVAMTRPKSEKKGTWQSWTVTAYFEDINKVKMFDKDEESGDKKLQIAYAFKKEGEGHVLEIDDRLMDHDEEIEESDLEAGLEMMKEHLKGFEVSRSVKMPGTVTSAKGFEKKEGRVASQKYDEASFKDKDAAVALMQRIKRKVVSGKSEMSDADVAAFKKELDEAKAAWVKIKEELKAEAERKKKDKKKEE